MKALALVFPRMQVIPSGLGVVHFSTSKACNCHERVGAIIKAISNPSESIFTCGAMVLLLLDDWGTRRAIKKHLRCPARGCQLAFMVLFPRTLFTRSYIWWNVIQVFPPTGQTCSIFPLTVNSCHRRHPVPEPDYALRQQRRS